MQPSAGIAGYQELVGGDPGQGGDGGIGHEEHAGGAIGAARIPKADGVVSGARSEVPITQHRQRQHRSLMPLKDSAAGAAGRIPQADGVVGFFF